VASKFGIKTERITNIMRVENSLVEKAAQTLEGRDGEATVTRANVDTENLKVDCSGTTVEIKPGDDRSAVLTMVSMQTLIRR
jgi:hypothetical protein